MGDPPIGESFAELTGELLAGMSSAVSSQFGRLEEGVTRMLAEHDRGIRVERHSHEVQIKQLTKRVDALASSSAENRTAVAKIGKTSVEDERVVPVRPAGASSEAYGRQTDGTTVWIRCPAVTPLSQISAAIASTSSDVEEQADQFSLSGPNDRKAFVPSFSGAAGLAARGAGKFISLQRVSGGR